MRRIQLSTDTVQAHEKYFKERIVPVLKAAQKRPPYPLTSEILHALKLKMSLHVHENRIQKEFSRQHRNIFRFVLNSYSTFATGKLKDLEALDASIQQKFPLVYELIRQGEYKYHFNDSYANYLNNLFGYNQFKVKDFFYYIKKRALNKLNKKQYSADVQKEIVSILISNFPKQSKEISDCLDFGPLNVAECEKEFRALKRLNITMDNFKQLDVFQEEWNDYRFVMESGIRVCPYCNRQYITPVLSDNGKMRSDIDHFLPKCDYPYFSMSLYNLVPVCKSCNQSLKGDRKFTFASISPYEDHISDYFRFKTDVLTNEISIVTKGSTDAVIRHLDVFKIECLYNYHQNQAAELIKKRIAYPDDYIHRLYEQNKTLFNSKLEVKQLIVGFIDDEDRLNEEAFLKFRRDLAEQLGFLGSGNRSRIETLKKIVEKTSP